MSTPKEDVVVARTYQKGSDFLGLYVREITGGNIDGTVFRFETWIDNVEDQSLRVESGDMFYVQKRYFAKLISLFEDGWKRTGAGVFASPHSNAFNPEVL